MTQKVLILINSNFSNGYSSYNTGVRMMNYGFIMKDRKCYDNGNKVLCSILNSWYEFGYGHIKYLYIVKKLKIFN